MTANSEYISRFNELMNLGDKIQYNFSGMQVHANTIDWSRWATSALSLIEIAMGVNSIHYINFKRLYDTGHTSGGVVSAARGVFMAAREDYQKGYHRFAIEQNIFGILFSDFVRLAKKCLDEGCKDSAAVLACAALEDSLKQYGIRQGLDIYNKEMPTVIDALKSKGLVSGAQKEFLGPMPTIRNYAMHAQWDKIDSETIRGIIGFVEQFILEHYKK